MYWKLIARFTVLIFIATFLAPIPFSVIEGYFISAGTDVPVWIYLAKFLAVLLAIAAVFTLLANTYRERILRYSRSQDSGGVYNIARDHNSFASVPTENFWPIINHAFFVALLSWLCSLPLNVIALSQPLSQWAFSLIPIMSMAVVGILIGSAPRRRRERLESPR